MAGDRRSYGTGRVFVRVDQNGRETFYGSWWADGRRVKRKLGAKRETGSRDGLTAAQAETRLRELMAEVNTSGPVKGDALTITQLGERYTADLLRQKRKKATITALDSILRVWLIPYFGDQDLRRVTVKDVERLVAMMENGERPGPRVKGDRRHGRPIGAKSTRNYIGTLSALLGFAERKGWLATNVARRVDLPGRPEHTEIRFLEPDEVLALADHATDGDYQAIDRALYITAAMTGLRQGELIALRWRDVDWTAGRVRVRRNYVLGEFGTPKSKRSTRSVPMADPVVVELDRLGEQGPDDLVFADPITGGPLDKAAILRRYHRALKAAKLPEAHRFHDLRHTFGTRMAAAGVPMRTLQEWMGHRDIETTQRYADYAPSAHEAQLVADAFKPESLLAQRGSIRGSVLSESQVISEHLSPGNTGF